jgi:hypothetical protein
MAESGFYNIARSEAAVGLFGKTKNKSAWPTAIATVDEIGVDGAKANASGAYAVNGEYYTVEFERQFRSAAEAETWAAQLETSPKIAV